MPCCNNNNNLIAGMVDPIPEFTYQVNFKWFPAEHSNKMTRFLTKFEYNAYLYCHYCLNRHQVHSANLEAKF